MHSDGSGLEVTGGQGGVGAALEDLSAAAARLVETAAETAEAAVAVLRVATSRRCCWRPCSDPLRAPSSRRAWPTSLARVVWAGRPWPCVPWRRRCAAA